MDVFVSSLPLPLSFSLSLPFIAGLSILGVGSLHLMQLAVDLHQQGSLRRKLQLSLSFSFSLSFVFHYHAVNSRQPLCS